MFQDIVCFFCQFCVRGIQILERHAMLVHLKPCTVKSKLVFISKFSRFVMACIANSHYCFGCRLCFYSCSMYVCWKPSWSYVVFVLGSVAQLGRTRELVCCICSGVRPVRRGSCCCRRTSFVGDWKDERNKKKTDVLTALNKNLSRSQGQCIAPAVIIV